MDANILVVDGGRRNDWHDEGEAASHVMSRFVVTGLFSKGGRRFWVIKCSTLSPNHISATAPLPSTTMPPADVIPSPYPNTLAANLPAPSRIVSRKGSSSAPDPLGKHVAHEKPRHVRSRLTVVRVPSDTVDMTSPASSLGVSRPIRAFSTPAPRGRLSFSASSFSEDSPRRNSSYVSRPVVRRNSGSQMAVRRPQLNPQQICELASTSLAAPVTNPLESVFRCVPASYYLPFLDRPAEITDLLATRANALLMTLLSLTFNVHNRDVLGDYATQDPTAWSYATLFKYMTSVTRAVDNDIAWLHNVRECIRAHSEIMWERVKDVLGVLPELDSDDPFYRYESPTEALEVAVDMGEKRAPSPDPETDFGVNDAWLEPVFALTVEEIEKKKAASPSGMETIGEEEEEHAEAGAASDKYKTQTTDEELFATRSIGALRFETAHRFVRGFAKREKKIEMISTPESSDSSEVSSVPRIEVTEPMGTPGLPAPVPVSPPAIRRWSTAPSVVPTYTSPITTITEEPEVEIEELDLEEPQAQSHPESQHQTTPIPIPPYPQSSSESPLDSNPAGSIFSTSYSSSSTSSPSQPSSSSPKPVDDEDKNAQDHAAEEDEKIIPQPTQTVPVNPITTPPPSLERRRHSMAVEPRFPGTFARLSSSIESGKGKGKALAQRVVHAGVVH
ncbi:hypothetical protein M422DRAFT_244423 [Sphaerobolus stellatus SS14]|nr:hypothetical protein M422DRAFT_244423 [Sphaerobolus stellatus SS14]